MRVIDIVGVIIPIIAFAWEFGIAGRKRLGFRTQMDTPVTGEVASSALGVLQDLRPGGDLGDLSIVLVRIENAGITTIDSGDYQARDDSAVGLRVQFPKRRVVGMAVSDISSSGLVTCLDPDSGIGSDADETHKMGYIDLPKVPLNRGEHYKVMAVLERWDPGTPGQLSPPEVQGGLKSGGVRITKSRTGPSRLMLGVVGFLVALTVGQFVVDVNQRPTRLDCETGQLTLVGSTAFGPVVRDAADDYMRTCPGSTITTNFTSTQQGLEAENRRGLTEGDHAVTDMVAFADGGALSRGMPELVARPIALGLFAVVVNTKTGVANLDSDQIKDLFAGRIANWSQIGGHDVPVHLIGRNPDSGTRVTFEQRFLAPDGQRQENSHDCQTADRPGGGTTLCLQADTASLLDEVGSMEGAVGYAELGSARAHSGVTVVSIDNFPASTDIAVHRGYPFWQTEFAYTFQDPPADSLAAGFLRYLTNQVGEDVIRAHRDLPCDALPNPVRCEPAP